VALHQPQQRRASDPRSRQRLPGDRVLRPDDRLRTGPDKFAIDNANVPVPTLGAGESLVDPGILTIRTKFEEFGGLYVMHCHRLNHEDNGLMGLINVIAAVSVYAVAVPGAPGKPAEVRLYDGNGDKLIATVIPFPGFEGSVNVAMGDVDGDGVLDLIVGAGKDRAPEVVAYTGAVRGGKGAFATEIARFQAFAPGARGGVSVAAAQIDGTPIDNIIVASGPGTPSEVKVYGSALPSAGAVPPIFSTFKALWRRSIRRDPRHRLRGLLDGSRKHRHCARRGHRNRDQGVRVSAIQACREGGSGCLDGTDQSAEEHRFVHSVRQGLSRRCFARDGLARGLARRRQADHCQPAVGRRLGQGLFERLSVGRRAGGLPA
jgi:hypothetical protein